MKASDSTSPPTENAAERFVVNPRVRTWKKDGQLFLGLPPDTLFEVSEEMVEFVMLFREPKTLPEIEEVADFETEVMDLLLDNELLVSMEGKSEDFVNEVVRPLSFTKLVRNFSQDMWRIATDVFRGEKLRASPETRERRREECSRCPFYVEASGRGLLRGPRCRACGCYLTPKTAFNASECPLGRW